MGLTLIQLEIGSSRQTPSSCLDLPAHSSCTKIKLCPICHNPAPAPMVAGSLDTQDGLLGVCRCAGTAGHWGRWQGSSFVHTLQQAGHCSKGMAVLRIFCVVSESLTEIKWEHVARWGGNLLHPHYLHTDTPGGVFHWESGISCRLQ